MCLHRGIHEKQGICALAVVFPFLILVSCSQPNVSTSFSFPYFSQNNSNQFIYMGNASYSASKAYIDLTPDPTGASSSNETGLQNCIGRVLYRHQLTLWPANFSITFTMLVQNLSSNSTGGQQNFNGDGLAFIIVPNKKTFLPDSYGAFLGMFDSSTDGNTTDQFAIEFDTYKNEFDPNNNHVGIDVKGIKSDATANLEEHGMDIKSGRPIRVRVDYDGWAKALKIYAAYADEVSSRGYASLLNRTIELSQTVPRSGYIGFSASTGNSFEIHRILDWNFSSVILPDSSLSLSPAPGPAVVPTGGGGGDAWSKVGVKIVVPVAITVALAALVSWLAFTYIKRKNRRTLTSGQDFSDELAMLENAPHRFPYRQLSAVTKNFSETELLGTGGFGSVYRGNLGGDGEGPFVAVKRISAASQQGPREFIAEIATIGRLRHRNLVQLQGWCHERDQLLLIYDYMPNGSLDRFIFGEGEHLNWQRRQRILCGLASALLYLHEEWEQRVVHRDVKPSNVMLDAEFNARLGDFGLARLIEHDDSSPAVTTRLAGTPGYVAPECCYTGKATAESDVFSFGIVLLEVATGRRVVERKPPLAEGNLVDWVWSLYGEERVGDCADPRLKVDGELSYEEREQIRRVLVLGLACSHPDPQLRPSVRQALQVLINPSEPLPMLPSMRPLAIYVVLPPVGAVYSQSTVSFTNRGGASSSASNETGMASITASTLHYGR
uniref:TSA: Wollemia nobilis Ref_Wollemi_Transcript_77_2478 transcribed RNA sequence n=1 Tax=Wollemia nobilis TaxID=56998 RepID=A0A0C9SB76_9CONI